MPVERLARFGERETPRCAVDEAHAEFSLQCSNTAAELRRLQTQCFRRRRVGAEIDHFGKEIEVVEIAHWGHLAALIILFSANMRSVWWPVQWIIARVGANVGVTSRRSDRHEMKILH